MRRAAEALLAAVVALTSCSSFATDAAQRRAVTFILGSDPAGSSFFSAGAGYYRLHERDGDETVVGLQTLAEVREYLARPSHRGDSPWGTIRLVAHGSEWYGLRVPIFFGKTSDRENDATLSALDEASASGAFPPLERDTADAQTRLVIESCGIARRPKLEHAIARLLFGADDRVRVVASRHYVAFRSWNDADGKQHAERMELPYVSLVTSAQTDSEFARRRLRATLIRRWSEETGLAANAVELVMRDMSIEVRYRMAATAAAGDASRASLYDLGLRHDQLHWHREGDSQVGRAHVVALAPAGASWSTIAEP